MSERPQCGVCKDPIKQCSACDVIACSEDCMDTHMDIYHTCSECQEFVKDQYEPALCSDTLCSKECADEHVCKEAREAAIQLGIENKKLRKELEELKRGNSEKSSKKKEKAAKKQKTKE
jgi:hypothetical protein